VSAACVILAIVRRDLIRAFRQKSRLIGGLSRPFMWLLLVGAGFNTIASVNGAGSYQVFVFPGVVIMASLFGGMLTAIATVYDREFGMLRLMLAAPAGVPAVLAGRALAAAAIGALQGAVVLAVAPLLFAVTASGMLMAAAVLVLASFCSALLGLVVAAPLRSVENFAGIINVVLFPILFLSGALYPTNDLPLVLNALARINPITYAVDLMRGALQQPTEFTAEVALFAIAAACVVAFAAAALLFDPERRFTSPRAVRAR
jgi:ABC-2 type transport system permease protein